jgi:hypothetical protein
MTLTLVVAEGFSILHQREAGMAGRTAVKATRVESAGANSPRGESALDVILGTPGGERYRRVDIEVRPVVGGGLHLNVEVPATLAPTVAALLAALGVKSGKGGLP